MSLEILYKLGPYFRFDGNKFNRVEDSQFSHRKTALGSYQGRPFITGGTQDNENRDYEFLYSYGEYENYGLLKTEIFSTDSLKWESGTDYPFASYRFARSFDQLRFNDAQPSALGYLNIVRCV